MSIKKVLFLGSADALKPLIILENIVEQNLLRNKELVYLCESEDGKCVEYCKKNNISVLVINDIKLMKDLDIENIKKVNADILVSVGWPNMIPKKVIDLFDYNPINCHGSFLPDYRGSRAYMHYWANCEEFYGASIHYINEKFDDGNIIVQGKLKMFHKEDNIIIHRRTAELCSYLLPTAINLVENKFEGEKIEGNKRYFYKLTMRKFRFYRLYNRFAVKFGLSKIVTKHKDIV